MAKGLIWTEKAKSDLILILEFWDKNNQSDSYSKRLGRKVHETLVLICSNNFLGAETNYPNVRVTLCENYLLFYEVQTENILVLAIFDGRRNPIDKTFK